MIFNRCSKFRLNATRSIFSKSATVEQPPVAAEAQRVQGEAVREAEDHVRRLRSFLEKHRNLLDRHVVDFYIAEPRPLR